MGSSWHHWELEKVFNVLQSQPSGISYTTARRRLRRDKPKRIWYLFFLLWVVGLLLFGPTRSLITSYTSLLSIAVFIFHGIIYRCFVLAKQRLQDFDPNLHPVIVKRDDRYLLVPNRYLAPGDIVRLQPGDVITANIRLAVLKDLVIAREEEGKWQTQIKDTTAPLPLNIPPWEHSNMVYGGSLVVEGEAIGVVVKNLKYKPSFPLIERIPDLLFLFGIWFFCGLIFLVVTFADVKLTIVYLLLILSVPCQWLNIGEVALLQGVHTLKEAGINLRSPFMLLHLSKIDKIVVDLNNYKLDKNFPSDISITGLWHGEEPQELDEIPVLKFEEGLALPQAQCLALLTDTKEDRTLISKTNITISSNRAEEELKRVSGVVLKENDIKLLEQGIREGRIIIDRLRRILLFSLSSGLALLFLLAIGKITTQTTITPLQMVWSGIVLPTVLSLLFLVEPHHKAQLPKMPYLVNKAFLVGLSLNIVMICLSTIVVFRFTSVSLAWTVFNFSLLALSWSLVRGQLIKFYQLLGCTSGFAIIQAIWLQTGRSGMTPLNIWSWAVAIIIASGIFWLNKLLDGN